MTDTKNYQDKTMLKNILAGAIVFWITAASVFVVSPQVVKADPIQVYKVEYNQHGRILRTSAGAFFLGRSGDAIL